MNEIAYVKPELRFSFAVSCQGVVYIAYNYVGSDQPERDN
jgi:hypothetical protein